MAPPGKLSIANDPKYPRYSVLAGNTPQEVGYNEFLPHDYEDRATSAKQTPRTTAQYPFGQRSSLYAHASSNILGRASLDPRLYQYLNDAPKRSAFIEHFVTDKSTGDIARQAAARESAKSLGATAASSSSFSSASPSSSTPKIRVDVKKICTITATVFDDRRYADPAKTKKLEPIEWAQDAVDPVTGDLSADAHRHFLDALDQCVLRDPPPKIKRASSFGQLPRYLKSTEASANKKHDKQAKLLPIRRRRAINPVDTIDGGLARKTNEAGGNDEAGSTIDRVLDQWKNIGTSKEDLSRTQAEKHRQQQQKLTSTGTYNPDLAASILQIAPLERSPAQIQTLYAQLRNVKAFSALSDFMLGQICSVVLYAYYENDRVVFKQGDIGTCWYVILKGSVKVNIAAGSNMNDQVTVAVLRAGAGFGDLALINDKPRAATIITADDCILARVEKADYVRRIEGFLAC